MLQKPSRRLWIFALVVSALCVGGLVYALIVERDTPAETRSISGPVTSGGSSGFGLGVLVGIGAGIVIGSLIALRKKS